MAQKVLLERDGEIKEGFVGFSWTVFFFSFWVPIFRGKFIDALAIFVGISIISYFTYGSGWFILSIILGFFYNKYYTENLLKEGFYPLDELNKSILRQKGIYIKDRD